MRALLVASVLLLAGCSAPPEPSRTALSGLDTARAAALEWNPAAELVVIFSGPLEFEPDHEYPNMPDTVAVGRGPLDGTSNAWTYFFWVAAPGVGQARPMYAVTVAAGLLVAAVPVDRYPYQFLPAQTINEDAIEVDSDEAVRLSGAPRDAASWFVVLGQSQHAGRPFWRVCYPNEGRGCMNIDATDGRVMDALAYDAYAASRPAKA